MGLTPGNILMSHGPQVFPSLRQFFPETLWINYFLSKKIGLLTAYLIKPDFPQKARGSQVQVSFAAGKTALLPNSGPRLLLDLRAWWFCDKLQ
jgi:hypothetical protein